jgi:hypothetical protein
VTPNAARNGAKHLSPDEERELLDICPSLVLPAGFDRSRERKSRDTIRPKNVKDSASASKQTMPRDKPEGSRTVVEALAKIKARVDDNPGKPTDNAETSDTVDTPLMHFLSCRAHTVL